MISKFLSFLTRFEGKKFLKLSEQIDETKIINAGLGTTENISLYVHIPFCKTLCPFCCFNRYLFKEEAAREYFKSLRKELDRYLEYGFTFSDIYFGGGTPTILMDELADFVAYLRENMEIRQISLETTAREINPQNITSLKAIGINRLSIGAQSFEDDVLKAMGRLPLMTGEEIKGKLLMAEGEFDTLNVDFVFNFPGQSIEQFTSDVAAFKELGIDQATFYPLMASPHKKDAMERRFDHVDTSREKRFYDIILNDVYAAGYEASTAWCFSKGARMIDEYIIDFDDYIGIGAGSVSIVNGNFYVNSFSLDRYGELLADDKLPIVRWRRLSDREHLHYYLLTKLFGMEVDSRKFARRFGADINKKLGAELLALKLGGLVQGKETIKVTPKGMYPVGVMMKEFFASLNTLREIHIEGQI